MIYITGGGGFIGSHLVDRLIGRGEKVVVVDDFSRGSKDNLPNGKVGIRETNLELEMPAFAPGSVVFHLAAKVAGIEYNRHNHFDMLQSNLNININVMEAVRASKPRLFVFVSTACVTGNTRVYNGGTYIPIDNATKAENTLTEQGPSEITMFHHMEPRPTIKIKTAAGFELQGAEDHHIQVWTSYGQQWKQLHEITEDDVAVLISGENSSPTGDLCLPTFVPTRKTKISFVKEIDIPTQMTSGLAELIGYWVGDGCYGINKQITFCDSDPKVLERMNDIVEGVFGITGKVKSTGRQIQLVICSTQLNQFFREALQLPSGAQNQIIPELIWKAQMKMQGAFLRGLFEADGTIGRTNKQISFTTVSNQLALDVQQLLWRLGIFSSVRSRPNKFPKNGEAYGFKHTPSTRYDLTVHGGYVTTFKKWVGFISERKKKLLEGLCDSRGVTIPSCNAMIREWYNTNKKPKILREIIPGPIYKTDNISKQKLHEAVAEASFIPPSIAFAARQDVVFDRIVSTEKQEVLQKLFDFTVPETSSYITNGFVSHNCVYPHDAPVPTPEKYGNVCDPEPTNHGYGVAKWVGEQMAVYTHKELNIPTIIVRFFNAFGKRDHYDEETSHVAPAIIKRVMDGEDPITVWGTGSQTRVLVDAKDIAKALDMLMDWGINNNPTPEWVPIYPTSKNRGRPGPIIVNIGHNREISIRQLTHEIIALSGREKAEIIYDVTKPDGYPRRAADTTRLKQLIGWIPDTPLPETLAAMIEDYKERYR